MAKDCIWVNSSGYCEGPDGGVAGAAANTALYGCVACGGVGLERRRIEHAEPDVPISRPVQSGDGGGASAGFEAVRHDLSGTVHGAAATERRGIQKQLGDQLCGRFARETVNRARFR